MWYSSCTTVSVCSDLVLAVGLLPWSAGLGCIHFLRIRRSAERGG
jgi:hypothetical protein